MSAFQSTSMLRFLAAFALFAFAGDIVADSLIDAQGDHCAAQTFPSDSQHDKTPCSHCSCAVHNASVIAADNGVHMVKNLGPLAFLLSCDESVLGGLPVAIDHPPQLA